MSGFKARARLFAVVSASAILAACSDSAPEPGAADGSASTSKPVAPKPASAGAQMVAAVSAGKTATAVGVHFSLGNLPKVATALPVDVAIITHEPFSSLQAHFETQAGLTLVSGEDLQAQTGVKAEATIAHQLVLMPDTEGVFVVTVSVNTEGKEGIVSRIFSIPVIVAPAAAPDPPPAAAPAPANSSGS